MTLREMAHAKAEQMFHKSALQAEPLSCLHQAMGALLAQEFAHYRRDILLEVFTAALEDANCHREAEVVRGLRCISEQ